MANFEFSHRTLERREGGILVVLLLVLPLGAGPALGQAALIAGRISDGSNGVSRVNVQAFGQTAGQNYSGVTDANGNYSLSVLQLDTYTVTPSQSGTVFEPVSCLFQSDCGTNTSVALSITTLSQTNVNFSVVYSISGRVVEGANGLANVQMSTASPPRSAVTDTAGNYTLGGFPRGGPYTVTPTTANYIFNPSSLAVTVASNVTGQNFTASAFFTVSGRIANGRLPLAGVQVTLQRSQTNFMANPTDTTGRFAFQNLAPGNYTVTPSLAGYAFNPAFYAVSGPTNVNFTVVTLPVAGRITEGTNGLAGVTVFAISATATTNIVTKSDGTYLFQNLAGTYTIMPSNSTDQFNPARRTLSTGAGLTAVDFQRGPPTTDVLVTTCDSSSVQLALSIGGTVGFGCGAAVGTVTFTGTVTITTNTFLDAAGATFSGGNAVRLFTVNPGVSLTLNNLSLTSGKDAGASSTNGTAGFSGNGGAIYNNGGVLALNNCVLTGNAAAGGTGGNGVVQLNGSGGKGGGGGSAFGGAIYNTGGSVSLTNCTLSGNTATGGAGANGADATSGGNFTNGGNGGDGGAGSGGAIFSTSGGTVVVYDCTIATNSVSGATGGAGGTGTFLGANGAPGAGSCGGICNEGGTLTVLFSTFYNNGAGGATGGDGKAGTGEARGASGTPGGAAGGGALYNSAGSLAATNCTFESNSVSGGQGGDGGAGGASGLKGGDGGNGGDGGSGRGGAIWNTANGSLLLVNCTITGNSALGGGQGTGGAAGTSRARSGNDGLLGEDYGGGIANTSGTITLINTLLGFNAPGDNGAGLITDGGYNLSDDASVPLTAMGSIITNLQQEVGFLGDNGGPTLTVPIFPGSHAVDAGNPDACPPTDQRHFTRVGRCDIGAFEFGGVAPTATLSIRLQTNQVVLSWTTALLGYSLQSSTNLSPTNWVTLTNTSNAYAVTNTTSDARRFYRLTQ